MSVYSIVYTSKAAGNLTEGSASDLDEILATARKRSSGCGVRGALVITEGRFVQVLEGEQTAVQGTFDRIVADPRHRDVVVLCAQPSSKPRFTDWSTAFVGDTPALGSSMPTHRWPTSPPKNPGIHCSTSCSRSFAAPTE